MNVDAYDFLTSEDDTMLTYFNPNEKDEDGYDYLETVNIGFPTDIEHFKKGGEIKVGDVYKNKLADFSDVEIEVLKITDRGYEVNKTYAKSYKGKKTDKRISKKDFITKLDFQWEYAPTYAKGGQTYAEGGEAYSAGLAGEELTKSHLKISDKEWDELTYDEKVSARRLAKQDEIRGRKSRLEMILAGEELTKSHLKISDKEWDELPYYGKVSARRLAKQDEIRGRKSRLEMMRAEEESKYFTGYLSFLNY